MSTNELPPVEVYDQIIAAEQDQESAEPEATEVECLFDASRGCDLGIEQVPPNGEKYQVCYTHNVESSIVVGR